MKVSLSLFSSVSHTPPTAPPNLSISMMTTDAESSSRREWVRKLKLTTLDNSSRDTSSESQAVSTRTDLP